MNKSVLICLSMLLAAQAQADPVQWPASAGGNDHYYGYLSSPGILRGNAWEQAMAMEWEGWYGVEFGDFIYISNEESTWGAIKSQYR